LVDFELLLGLDKLIVDIFDFIGDLVSLFLKVRFTFLVLLNFLVILTYFSDSFEVFVVILNDVNIRFLFIIFLELILFFRFLLTLFIFLFIFILIRLFLFFLHFLLFLEFLNSFSLPYFIIPNDSLPHVIILRVHKLFENFLFIVKLFLQLLVYWLKLIYFIGKTHKSIF